MRMSCNGCRVLRKGCGENCSIRPCLQWIKNPESQANATVFLAKFYGRAGLMNLINAGPAHLRPAIFRSLLYETCGRIVNPIYGSVGLLSSGSWQMCQAAVEAVLKGAPIVQISSETAAETSPTPLKAFDIRHVSKDGKLQDELHKVSKTTRTRFKRSRTSNDGVKPKPICSGGSSELEPMDSELRWGRAASHESENESTVSGETAEHGGTVSDGEVELELTLGLGLEPVSHCRSNSSGSGDPPKRCEKTKDEWGSDTCRVDLALDIAA